MARLILALREERPRASYGRNIPAAKLQSRATIGSRVAGLPFDGGESEGKFLDGQSSELNHGKIGDSLEVAQVQGCYVVAEMQRSRAD